MIPESGRCAADFDELSRVALKLIGSKTARPSTFGVEGLAALAILIHLIDAGFTT
jgi:hypothetical protein